AEVCEIVRLDVSDITTALRLRYARHFLRFVPRQSEVVGHRVLDAVEVGADQAQDEGRVKRAHHVYAVRPGEPLAVLGVDFEARVDQRRGGSGAQADDHF